ncbi:MAG TPA: GNAT family N-acetyltransferase [Caldilineaceae bacterium]|nr:GNAT family N-acetyltransferase [Caldilineaceae bacterium]
MSTVASTATAEQPAQPPPAQLRMVWPQQRLHSPPEVRVHPEYELRTYRPGDEQGWIEVMAAGGFTGWDEPRIKETMATILPAGWFMAVHRASGQIVATAMATHNPLQYHPFGGELGWVAAQPAHKGHGLGMTVCAAVTVRLLSAGYENIYLRTDDWRFPALVTYLKLGYQPFLFAPDMAGRWEAICAQLGWPFTREAWPQPEISV